MDEKLITLISYETSAEAHLTKTKLEDNGIPAFVFDDQIVGVHPYLSNAVGGVKVKIPESYSESAIKVLGLESKIEQFDPVNCPECNSDKTKYLPFNPMLILISFLLLGIPFPYLKRKWKCNYCGHRWKSKVTSK